MSPQLSGHRTVARTSRRIAAGIARTVLPWSLVVWRGPRTSRRVALTFDDGPDELTRQYLDELDRFGAQATFFVLGEQCADYPELVVEIADRGHELGNHGYSHQRFPESEDLGLLGLELARTEAFIPRRGGGRRIVRPPFGAVTPRSLWACARSGYTTVLWSHDSDDCRTRHPEEVVERVAPAVVEPGAIVLLHEGQSWTLAALPKILEELTESGHELVTVGQLLDG